MSGERARGDGFGGQVRSPEVEPAERPEGRERAEVGDPRLAQIELLQPRKPRDRREVDDPRPVQIELHEVGELSERGRSRHHARRDRTAAQLISSQALRRWMYTIPPSPKSNSGNSDSPNWQTNSPIERSSETCCARSSADPLGSRTPPWT